MRDEDGFLPLFIALALPIIIFAWGLAVDFGRAHIARAELQTASDAGALAAALTAEPVPVDIEYVPITETVEETVTVPATDENGNVILDENGNPVMVEKTETKEVIKEVREIVHEWKAVIKDETKAESEARAAFAANSGRFPQQGVELGGWTGDQISEDSYYISANARMKAPWAGAAAAMMTGDRSYYKIPVSAKGTGQAVPKFN
ncbi:TadE/TadG family type IV pilus assembly protein [Desulfofundulus thermobenzoicus]|uniref:TadE/TadG family type IV pilus assembly protein n=1 Tax=Desulfofundulus thermobenzoicus TaxID=29376 RepID=UPI00128EEC71|nr:pilus assembly protein TadG-related protein [Desulfofundulus thermobenzoicus]